MARRYLATEDYYCYYSFSLLTFYTLLVPLDYMSTIESIVLNVNLMFNVE